MSQPANRRSTLVCYLVAILLFSIPMITQEVRSDEEQNALSVAKNIAEAISHCPRREIVAQSKKHWAKEAWGPPSEVSFDVERTRQTL
jgi:hypothetical protein